MQSEVDCCNFLNGVITKVSLKNFTLTENAKDKKNSEKPIYRACLNGGQKGDWKRY